MKNDRKKAPNFKNCTSVFPTVKRLNRSRATGSRPVAEAAIYASLADPCQRGLVRGNKVNPFQ